MLRGLAALEALLPVQRPCHRASNSPLVQSASPALTSPRRKSVAGRRVVRTSPKSASRALAVRFSGSPSAMSDHTESFWPLPLPHVRPMTAAETFCASKRTHRAVMRSCCDGGLLSLRLEGDPKRLQCWAVSPLPPRRADHSNAAVHFTRNRAHLRCHSHTCTAPTLTATSLQVFQPPMTLHYIRAKPPPLPHKRVAAGVHIFSAAARAHDA